MAESDELRARADQLYRRGLLLVSGAADADLKKAGELWREACGLYRRAGDDEQAARIEAAWGRLASRLVRLPQRLSRSQVRDHDSLLSGEPLVESIWQRERSLADFKDWHSFFIIGCFGFGGPFAVWGLLEDEMVRRKKVLSHKDFLEAAVLGDILPGPVTMDIVTYTGYKLRRWWGSALATGLFVLPSFLLMLFLAARYDQFIGVPWVKKLFHALGAAVTAIVISVGLDLSREQLKTYVETGIFVWAFVSSLLFKFDMLAVVVLAGLAGLLLEAVQPTAAGGRA
jgi:chromate transporter